MNNIKKILLAVLVGTATMVSISSCTEKEFITKEVNVLDGVSYVFPVKSNEWVKDETNTYRKDIAIKDLDQAYYEDGHVNLAINIQAASDRYEAVPSDLYGYKFSFNYSIGIVRVYAVDIGSAEAAPPENMNIKVILTDAQIGN